jgi:hypothetical protein
MFTICYPSRNLAPLLGTGLVLASLFACLTLPAVSVAGAAPAAYQDYQGHRNYWGQRDYWGHRNYPGDRRPRYELPDRYTIHKGKKCQIRCERIWGTRDYRCREYRC